MDIRYGYTAGEDIDTWLRHSLSSSDYINGEITREGVESVTYAADELDDAYRETLDSIYGDIEIGHDTYSAGEIVEKLNPTDFEIGRDEMYVEIDVDEYRTEDEIWEDVENEG